MPEASNNQPSSQQAEQGKQSAQQQQAINLSTAQIADLIKQGIDANSPDGKHQAHGKTIKEMRELHLEQRTGKDKTISANLDSSVAIKECDQHLIHAEIEDVEYDRKGKRLSKARIQ